MNEIRVGRKMELLPSCPALVVIGAEDKDIKPETSVALVEQLHADVHLYAGASHVGPLLGRRAVEIATSAESWLAFNITSITA